MAWVGYVVGNSEGGGEKSDGCKSECAAWTCGVDSRVRIILIYNNNIMFERDIVITL